MGTAKASSAFSDRLDAKSTRGEAYRKRSFDGTVALHSPPFQESPEGFDRGLILDMNFRIELFCSATAVVDICSETLVSGRMMFFDVLMPCVATAEVAGDVACVPVANGDTKGSTICTRINAMVA